MYEQNNRNNPLSNAGNNALWNLQGRYTDDMNSAPFSIPENIFTNPALQPSSVINLSNSSGVVIGPMTQYQGPVTIYQYMDATVEARSMQASNGGINQTRNTNNTTVKQKLKLPTNLLTILKILVVIIIIIAVIIIYMELSKNNNKKEPTPILFGNDYDHHTFPNLGNGHLIIDRTQWGASELAKTLTIPLQHPIPYVLITHIGVQSKPCYNIYKCSIKMRTIQDSAIAEKNLPDIQSNFYVADDGNIYVGRGWDWANTYANNTLGVTFLGDYGRYIPSESQLQAAQYLLVYGLTKQYLSLDYKVVAQNQTKATKSPGVNVYRTIRTWPRFYPCGNDNNPKCGTELGMPELWDANM